MARLGPTFRGRPPIRPRFTVLTDRADGKLWVLSHDATGEYVTLNDEGLLINPSVSNTVIYSDFIVYGPYDGPIVPDEPTNPRGQIKPQKRLLVRNGYLGYERAFDGQEQGRVMTRRKMSRILRRIFVPDSWKEFDSGWGGRDDDTLGYRFEDLDD